MEEECLFNWKFKCDAGNKTKCLGNVTAKRIETIIKCSEQYEDNIHEDLQTRYDSNRNLVLRAHRSCVDTYCHPTQVKRAIQRQQSQDGEGTSGIPTKRARRSEIPQFNFIQHCFYCGELCKTERDPKNPSRWRSAFVCRQVERMGQGQSLKEEILHKCDERNDKWASEVRLRVAGAVSDLHAADARYHVDCRTRFTSQRSVSAAVNVNQTKLEEVDQALACIIRIMEEDLSRIWNSVELYDIYIENGGYTMSRRLLVSKLSEHFKDDLLILSSPGIATILAFKSRASKALRVIEDLEDDDSDIALARVKNKISQEVKDMRFNRNTYNTRLNHEIITENVSSTVMDLLARLTPKLDNTLPSLLIGNIITSVLTNHPTQLQISLAVLLRDSKELVKTMGDFGVTCTYDELLRFKKSAAVEASKNTELTAISKAEDGLVQVVVDNFDADIASQNGKLSTHSLAVLLTQPDTNEHQQAQEIRRLNKAEMSRPIEYELDIMRYDGTKKPEMPALKNQVPPLSILAHMVVSQQRACESDLRFLTDIVQHDGCPEFNGYNTRMCREQGHAPRPKTKAVYLPLIDMPPAHPDTIMTAMSKAQTLTEKTGQSFTLFTADQQLYKVAVQVKWVHPDLFPRVIPRLGGMHMLMSFVGAVGTLMAESGLADILSSTFGGVYKMLSGKKFPMNMRAMRMVAEELLRDIVGQSQMKCHDDLMKKLEDLSKRSRTTKMWVDILIKPVQITMLYIRAEREGDWPLHLLAVKLMLPYFFASGHVNYARYGLYYLRSMEALPSNVLQHYMKGSHVMRHIEGLWNGTWSDMFIETTFMRYGHGKAGIIGITLKPETLKTWALSLHICGQLVEDVAALRENDKSSNSKTTHKEESKARISADNVDREGLRRKLEVSINPMDPDQHPENIINVVTGRIAPASVDVDRAVDIGTKQMHEFQQKLPGGFYDTISKKVHTMAAMKKSINVGGTKVYDTNLIYSRVIGLQASSRDVDIKDILTCELSPVPTALFDNSGNMRTPKSKADLKNLTKVEMSARHETLEQPCTVIDGCALLWIPNWPSTTPTKQPTVMDFVNKFKRQVEERLKSGDVCLVFDRYKDYSTKCATRVSRGHDGSRVFQLSPTSLLPSQKLSLTVTDNKVQLIDIICASLQNDEVFRNRQKHKLVITGQDDVPVEVMPGGDVIPREDLSTTHEEADNIIVQQAIQIAANEKRHVRVLADDTDVYVLLLHHYLHEGLRTPMTMESPIKDRTVIDIPATVDKLGDIIPSMLAGHALTGCDTVGAFFGIGKGTMLKVMKQKSRLPLDSIGNVDAAWLDVITQSIQFIASCYGQPTASSMSEARINVWTSRVGRPGATNTPNLASLPPTTEAFEENVKRAHLQTCVWKHALQARPPPLDPTQYGYAKEEETKSLIPVTVPTNVQLAPDNILRLIRCTCTSGSPCKSSGCRCNKAKLACTIFCGCRASVECCNDQTKAAIDIH